LDIIGDSNYIDINFPLNPKNLKDIFGYKFFFKPQNLKDRNLKC